MNTNPTNAARSATPPAEGDDINPNPNAPLPIASVQQAAREAPATAALIVSPAVIVPPQQRPTVIVRNTHVPMPEPVAGPSRTPEPVAGPSQAPNPWDLEPFALYPGAEPEYNWRRKPYDPDMKKKVLELYAEGMNKAQIRRRLIAIYGEGNIPQQVTINNWINKDQAKKADPDKDKK